MSRFGYFIDEAGKLRDTSTPSDGTYFFFEDKNGYVVVSEVTLGEKEVLFEAVFWESLVSLNNAIDGY